MNNPFCFSLSDHSFYHSTLFFSLSNKQLMSVLELSGYETPTNAHENPYKKQTKIKNIHSDYSVFQVFPVSIKSFIRDLKNVSLNLLRLFAIKSKIFQYELKLLHWLYSYILILCLNCFCSNLSFENKKMTNEKTIMLSNHFYHALMKDMP